MNTPPLIRHPTLWTFLTRLTLIVGALVLVGMLVTLISFAASNHQLGLQVRAQGERITEQNVQIKGLSKTAADTSVRVKQILAQFQDCITVGGKCQQQSQRQTEQVIAELERVVLAANSCPGVPSIPSQPPAARLKAVSACVAQLLNQGKPNGRP